MIAAVTAALDADVEGPDRHVHAAHQRDEAGRQAQPERQPEHRSDGADDERLGQHRRGRHAPRCPQRAEHAELAHALEHRHVEAVQDEEAAHEQRDAREEVEDDVQAGELLAHLVGELGRGLHVHSAPRHLLDARLERFGLAAVPGRYRYLHPAARLIKQPACGAERHRGVAEPTDVQAARQLEDADDRQPRLPGRAGRADPVADVVAMVARPVLLDHDLHTGGHLAPLDKTEVVGLVALRLISGDQHLTLGALDRAAVRVEPGEHAADHARRIANTLDVLDPVERVGGHRAAALAHHDQVGLAPRAVDHLVEGGPDGPHQQQDAENHPDTEHDAEGCQSGAQRPRSQLPQRQGVERAQHRSS